MRLLTYNCCALPVLAGDIKARLELVGSEIVELDPDVVVMQEVFLPRHFRLLQGALRDWSHSFSGVRPWRSFAGGLAVFSKFPLVEPRFVRFQHQGPLLRYSALARLSRKGIVSTLVRPPSAPPFRLVTTHPVADYRMWRSGEAGPDAKGARSTPEYLWKRLALARGDPYPELQAGQMADLTRHVLASGRDLPLVVAGDLNVVPSSGLLRGFLASTGLRDCMEGCLEPSMVTGKYYRLPYHGAPNKRIDYVLVRDGSRERFTLRSARYVLDRKAGPGGLRCATLSDHLGVLVELSLSMDCVGDKPEWRC
ncbi:MAG: endonuclease/exonuclease/phosphatase family protein [Elusimicrobia bacterium]|nr:endonuclease/exonuclease/phosphatase family protein [Elusimicrobiota bacterium]